MSRNRNRYTRNATYRATVNTAQPVRTYNGDAWVYILASRVNPNLAKVGTGNPTQRCAHWATIEPGGLFIFEAYEFATRHEADAVENAFHEAYQFANRNPDPTQGSQEFYTMPPSQAKVYLDRAHTAHVAQAAITAQAAACAAAEQRAADAEAALANANAQWQKWHDRAAAAEQREGEAERCRREADYQIEFLIGAIERNPDVIAEINGERLVKREFAISDEVMNAARFVIGAYRMMQSDIDKFLKYAETESKRADEGWRRAYQAEQRADRTMQYLKEVMQSADELSVRAELAEGKLRATRRRAAQRIHNRATQISEAIVALGGQTLRDAIMRRAGFTR